MIGMSIGKARSELQAAMSGTTGRQWCYTPAVTAVLAALEEAEQRITDLKSQVKAQAPVLPEGVPIELRDEIIDLCNGYEIGDVGAQEIWEACRAAMHAATISNSADFAIDEAEPVSQPYKLVGEVVAWNAPQQQGVYRSVDFRWIDMDVPPGTKLYAMDKE